MNEIHIRQAVSSDLQALKEIAQKTLSRKFSSFLNKHELENYNTNMLLKDLEQHHENCDVLVQNGDIVAFTIFTENKIKHLIVDIAKQKTGIGRLLLVHTERELHSDGSSLIRAETLKGNQVGRHFLIKHGWKEAPHSDEEAPSHPILFEKKM